MTQNYDEVRPDVAERNAEALKEVETLDAPDAQSTVEALDESEVAGVQELPGAIIDEQLVVEVHQSNTPTAPSMKPKLTAPTNTAR